MNKVGPKFSTLRMLMPRIEANLYKRIQTNNLILSPQRTETTISLNFEVICFIQETETLTIIGKAKDPHI